MERDASGAATVSGQQAPSAVLPAALFTKLRTQVKVREGFAWGQGWGSLAPLSIAVRSALIIQGLRVAACMRACADGVRRLATLLGVPAGHL